MFYAPSLSGSSWKQSPGTSNQTRFQNDRAALISLLADEDVATYSAVKTKLLSYGTVVEEWLRPLTISNDPIVRRRVREILEHQARQRTIDAFLKFCEASGERLNLEQGCWLLAQTRYPFIKPDAYTALLDMWGADLSDRMARMKTEEARLGEFNRFVFTGLKFDGSLLYGQDPDCCFLNRIIDKRMGNPIGLSAVYLFLARRVRLPMVGIGMPGHFICRYQSAHIEMYVDCFRRGTFISRADCLRQLRESKVSTPEVFLEPATPRQILLRMCRNVVMTYGHLEMGEEAGRAQRYVEALAGVTDAR
jgi:regulator of sirC expression with transglutaminase-like and TPR domain